MEKIRNNRSEIVYWEFWIIVFFFNLEDVEGCFTFDFLNELTRFVDYLIENYIAKDSRFPSKLLAETNASLKRASHSIRQV